MEAMGILGFIFGLAGLSYAMKAKSDIAHLQQEFADLKTRVKSLHESHTNDPDK
ncbi:hypothetical protein [Thalassotalea litorea]|uniref:hypothetical protein n=1 Tax=Thalassotalea litorea TaxID=2020715 RepID=UPI0037354C03